MANGSEVELIIDSSKVLLMDRVLELIEKDYVPGGAFSNMHYFDKWVDFDDSVTKANRIALFDPQTSGGLLISVPHEKAGELLDELKKSSVEWAMVIGEVFEKGSQKNVITVV
jgi:selenide,water dikinase